MRVVALIGLVAATTLADAEPVRVRFYAHPSMGIAIADNTGIRGALHVHGSLGAAIGRASGLHVRVGPTLELFPVGLRDEELGIGVELQVDHPVTTCWRIGGRIAVGRSLDEQHGLWMAGLRMRGPIASFGLDAFALPSDYADEPSTRGVIVTAGLEGTPGRYGLLIGGIGGLLLTIVLLSGMSGSH